MASAGLGGQGQLLLLGALLVGAAALAPWGIAAALRISTE
jgi:ABC-type transport system involved in cytochrome c biogenesis permease component